MKRIIILIGVIVLVCMISAWAFCLWLYPLTCFAIITLSCLFFVVQSNLNRQELSAEEEYWNEVIKEKKRYKRSKYWFNRIIKKYLTLKNIQS